MISRWRQYRLVRQSGLSSSAWGVSHRSLLVAPLLWFISLPGRFLGSGLMLISVGLEPLLHGARRPMDWIVGLPAGFALVGLIAATAVGHVRQTKCGHSYWAKGAERLEAGDPVGAQILLQKALEREHDKADRHEMLRMLALAWEQSGDRERADVASHLASLVAADDEGDLRWAAELSTRETGGDAALAPQYPRATKEAQSAAPEQPLRSVKTPRFRSP